MTIPYITLKQQEIIKLLYKFRFINTKQIQEFLHHKDKKTINMWLRDLRAKQYVIWDYHPDTFGENTKLAVYHTGLNGIRFLRSQNNTSPNIIRKLYRDDQREKPFITRCILIAAICLQLEKETNKKAGDESFTAITASEYALSSSPFRFLTDLKDYAPDLVITEQAIGQKADRRKYYILSINDITLPRYRVRSKIRKYIEFYFNNGWENSSNKKFPIIRIVAPTKADMIYTKRFARKALKDNQNPKDLHIQFTTADEIQKTGFTATSWEEVE